MSYTDHVHSSSKPSCWGKGHHYDPDDLECTECRWCVSCGASCGNGLGVRTRTEPRYNNRTQYRPEKSDTGEAGIHRPAVIGSDEAPITRFAKDAVGGGLRGMFYEMWQFWRHYRIR